MLTALHRPLVRVRTLIGRFSRASEGIAATEFALLLPVMVGMYLGTVEVTQGILAKRRVNLMVRTLADLTSQTQTFSSTGLQTVFDAAKSVMAPLDTSTLQMRITSVIIKTDGTTCIDWSEARNMGALPVGGTVALPAGLADPTATKWQSIILAESVYRYTPVVGYVVTGPIDIKDSPAYMRPRSSDRVTVDGKAYGCTAITG